MTKAFKELKCLMIMQDKQQSDLARVTGKSQSYITERMSARKPFDMDDVYAICKEVGIAFCDIPKYFPPKGITQKGATQCTDC